MLLISLFVPTLIFIFLRSVLFKDEGSLIKRFLITVFFLVIDNAFAYLMLYLSRGLKTYPIYMNESFPYLTEYLIWALVFVLLEIGLEFLVIKKRREQFVDSRFYRMINDHLKVEYIDGEKGDQERSHCILLICAQLIFLILVLLCFALKWEQKHFGSVDIDGIIFTLKMPLVGSQQTFYEGIFAIVIVPTLVLFLFETVVLTVIMMSLRRNKIKAVYIDQSNGDTNGLKLYPVSKRLVCSVFVVWLILLLVVADMKIGLTRFIFNQVNQSEIIENEYVSPEDVEIVFPETKRNLVYIYVESLESSLQDKASGGLFEDNYIPELTKLAHDNISFSHSDLIEGATVAPACGWTVAGMVAESAGLPLKLFTYDDMTVDNSMDEYAYFLPGAVSLGDILEKEGYINYFMCGSDLEFGGRMNYLTQHGNYQYFDYYSAIEEGKIAEDYYVWWGFEDIKLFEYAKEKLLMLADSGQPFNFSILTVDTHNGGGYICELCRHDYEENYANIFACSSRQVSAFVEWIMEQDFYENTTIIICGDHCSMDGEFYAGYEQDKHTGGTVRKVYNVIINAPIEPIKEEYRKFTTLDMFPTTLAAMGATIEGERLGLGTNLFSGRETLAEQYGYDVLFDDLNRSSKFYNDTFLYPDLD